MVAALRAKIKSKIVQLAFQTVCNIVLAEEESPWILEVELPRAKGFLTIKTKNEGVIIILTFFPGGVIFIFVHNMGATRRLGLICWDPAPAIEGKGSPSPLTSM